MLHAGATSLFGIPAEWPSTNGKRRHLAALEHKPVSNAFPVRAAALLFPERGRPGLVPVVVDLKTTPLTFTPAPDGKSYSSDFTVLVQFLDDQNKVARRVSQHYDIRGPIEQIDRATQGDVIFYRESELAPGVYTVETIVHDAPSGKSSVRLSTVEVPKHAEGQLRMSSLVLVSRSESVPSKDRSAPHPLVVGDVLLRPNLGDPVSESHQRARVLFRRLSGSRWCSTAGADRAAAERRPRRPDCRCPWPPRTPRVASSRSAGCQSPASPRHLRATGRRHAGA